MSKMKITVLLLTAVGIPAFQHQHSENYETILLAEDEPELRKLFGMILRLAGYNVLTASDGKEALQLTQPFPPDKKV